MGKGFVYDMFSSLFFWRNYGEKSIRNAMYISPVLCMINPK